PNVDSVLVGLERRGLAAPAELRRLVHAAFAHRRKTLAGSLSLAPDTGPDRRARARRALESMGLAADSRAERLAPEQFRELANRMSR
ncbi:MAG: ribosomal RNA small subunit methyltransferase A, partial [Pseudonocardiales bacterium]